MASEVTKKMKCDTCHFETEDLTDFLFHIREEHGRTDFDLSELQL